MVIMAKARSRAAARRMKDKWKAKSWYNVIAPASFDHVTIAETLSDDPDKLMDRVTEVSLQDLTNDFRKSHYKLFFKVHNVEDTNAHTQYIGHTLTSDYLRRMVRRKRSKIEAVYDITTRDGAKLRIKPFATTDRRIQNSQKKIIRDAMRKTIVKKAKSSTLSEFVKLIVDGRLGKDIYQSCKKLYPVKRIEIYKTELVHQPRIQIEEPKKEEPVEEESEETTKQESTEPTGEKEPSETEVEEEPETRAEDEVEEESTQQEDVKPEKKEESESSEKEVESEEPKEQEQSEEESEEKIESEVPSDEEKEKTT